MNNCDCEYRDARRIVYGDDGATFVPICVNCRRFVKPDRTVLIGGAGLSPETNATCSKCGRTHMHFEGFE